MSRRYLFLSVLFFFISISHCFCENLTGKELSDNIFNFFSKNNFSNIEKISLAKTGQDEFAYNILISFNSNKISQENLESEKSNRNNMILVFTQEDTEKRLNEFLDFLSFIKKLENKTYNLQILFSALDEQIIENDISGTKTFAKEIFDTDSTFAIIVKFDEIKKYSLLTGAKNFTTPLWLTKQITNTFIESNIELENTHKLSSLYRLGILTGNSLMSQFFNVNIPATTLKVFDDKEKTTFFILKTLIQKIDLSNSFEWDSHYMFLKLTKPFVQFWINESILVITFIIVITFSLLILCGFSFIGKTGANHKKEFLKIWYMIPFEFGISIGAFLLSQKILENIAIFQELSFFYLFSGKILISLLIITVLFFIQDLLKLPINNFVFGYTSSFCAIFNILFFSSIDILFFILFSIEYLIIHISRPAKRIFFILFFLSLLFIPFIPYIYTIFSFADDKVLEKIVFADWKGNFVLSFAFFPLQLYYQKILVRLQISSGFLGYSFLKQILKNIAFCIIFFSIVGLCIFYSEELCFQKTNLKNTLSIEENKNADIISTKITRTEFLGMNTNRIKISSKKKVLKYEVKIINEADIPIYESSYDYKMLDNNEISFFIPNYPPQNITIDYVSENESKSKIVIESTYIEEKDGKQILFSEKHTVKNEQ